MTNNKRIILWCGLALLIALILNSFDIYANYEAVSSNGSDEILWSAMFFLVIPLLAIVFVVIPISLIGVIFKRSRRVSVLLLMSCVIYLGVAKACFWCSGKVRMAAFHKLAERSKTLVQAIKEYELRYGNLPASLENLVPEFLPNIPQTGMGAYPEYEYKVGEEAQEFAKDAWCLVVNTPLGGLNWDIFIYFPNQDYTECGWGGVLEKVKDWAYVHE
ncbi:MAG TPA: hypothetical protein VMW23_01290 [Sedimentisphaerales bacterium]|nr:hypothetical protein [Sedimentisphaerales bacterium]